MMIRLSPVSIEQKPQLWNLLQQYLQEMTGYYTIETDVQGNYRYQYFDAYFSDPQRKACFIRDERAVIGFVLINPYSSIGEKPDFTMAEFYISPMYRRQGLGMEAAAHILKTFHGHWEIKYCNQNTAAKRLWTKAAEPYHPVRHDLDNTETVLSFSTI